MNDILELFLFIYGKNKYSDLIRLRTIYCQETDFSL